MDWTLILLVAVVLIAVFVKVLASRIGLKLGNAYVKKPHLFSPAERSFLGVLNLALGNDYAIFGKVRVADVLSVATTSNRSRWQQAFNQISAKHFDYVICSKTELEIVAAIELDDKSHNHKHRQRRDKFLEAACGSAKLPLVRFAVKQSYQISEVREHFISKVQPTESNTPAIVTSVELTMSPEVVPNDNAATTQLPVSNTTNCPKCSLPMVKRAAKSGDRAGQLFWACSGFPKCRSISPIDE